MERCISKDINGMSKQKSSVERDKASSILCKKIFPLWSKPPTQGELQKLIQKGWSTGLDENGIKNAGNWWLWLRNLIIENTFSKSEKEKTLDISISSSLNGQPVHFVSSRSPELLHAQVTGQADLSLPRSRKALVKLKQIADQSSIHLPTKLTILFADVAIDNIDQISTKCDIEKTIQDNLHRLEEIALEEKLSNFKIVRMTQMENEGHFLSELIAPDGEPKVDIELNDRGKRLIEIATKESKESHKRMFGWNDLQSIHHNTNIAITMGTVGRFIKNLNPPAVVIHNESFISRGQLNNLFNPIDEPIPVICLKDLLESKKPKL